MLQVLRVAGIPVRIDASWLLIFALISWSLAVGYFPLALPDVRPAAAWLHGVVAAALLFVSVLMHELSHALVARRRGVRVNEIRLHVFGGVSELASEPPTPAAETLIAVVGPLTSFAIAVLCYGLGRTLAGMPWALALTGYLAAVNLIVGLFNLVPGLPLDGGRLLRAMLWWWSDHPGWATRWASRAGSAFAFGLIALGLARAARGEVVGGLWFALLGLFLRRAARASFELARVRERLEPLRVADVMRPLATTVEGLVVRPGDAVGPEVSAWEGYLALDHTRASQLAVVEGGRLVGVIGRRDLQRALAVERVRADVGRRAA